MAADNKTEQATPRRRQKAREQGQVARSREVSSSLAVMTLVLVIGGQAAGFAGAWKQLLAGMLDRAGKPQGESSESVLLRSEVSVIEAVSVSVMLAWMTALAGALAQGGMVVAPTALVPKLSRLNPGRKLEQLFSLTSVGRLLKSLLPGGAMVWIAVSLLQRDWAALVALPHLNPAAICHFIAARVLELAWKSSLVLVVWSLADYMIERHRLSSDLRMSRQELKEEFKDSEGNPLVKARLRRLRRHLLRRKMLEDAKRAAVVITNPNEFAVALEYAAELGAPRVVAKGRNLFAQQIKQIARWQNIPLVENPPLAHALYRSVEVGQFIPPKLYAVVAAVLAAIYRAQESARQSSARTASGGSGR
jgi:flagellar biosynthetic protein FlhB